VDYLLRDLVLYNLHVIPSMRLEYEQLDGTIIAHNPFCIKLFLKLSRLQQTVFNILAHISSFKYARTEQVMCTPATLVFACSFDLQIK